MSYYAFLVSRGKPEKLDTLVLNDGNIILDCVNFQFRIYDGKTVGGRVLEKGELYKLYKEDGLTMCKICNRSLFLNLNPESEEERISENSLRLLSKSNKNQRRHVQFSRGNKEQNDKHIGSIGEVTEDLESCNLRVHDGKTPGGIVV